MILPENFRKPDSDRLDIPAIFTSSSEKDTFSLGKKLGLLLEKGNVVALRGELGAGKTCFIKGIASALFIEENPCSPSYTIVNEYEGSLANGEKTSVYHIDAYRLGGNDDFMEIGGKEIVFGDGISLIEWSERINDFITPGAFIVDIKIKSDTERLISIYTETNK